MIQSVTLECMLSVDFKKLQKLCELQKASTLQLLAVGAGGPLFWTWSVGIMLTPYIQYSNTAQKHCQSFAR